jgi:hypothetical protein
MSTEVMGMDRRASTGFASACDDHEAFPVRIDGVEHGRHVLLRQHPGWKHRTVDRCDVPLGAGFRGRVGAHGSRCWRVVRATGAATVEGDGNAAQTEQAEQD